MNLHQELRAWFFTNEALADFLFCLPATERVKRVLGIAGGGDFAFNFLSQDNRIEQMVVCDNRLSACLTVRLKKMFFQNLSRLEFLTFFFDRKILKKFKKAKIWYGDSFRSARSLAEYAPYLLSDERFARLKNRLPQLEIVLGDFLSVLKKFPDGYFDLIYVSNIFDSRSYFCPTDREIRLIKNKLSSGGRLLAVAQDTQKALIKKFAAADFFLANSEIHRFNLWRSLWRYDYSFLLFEKKERKV